MIDSKRVVLGVDLMGATAPPEELLKSALLTSRKLVPVEGEFYLKLFGLSELASEFPEDYPFVIHSPATEVVNMDDHPLGVVRRKRDASMIQGILALRRGEIDAFISMGNTGALIAASSTLLPRLSPRIERPVLLALLPTISRPVAVLDVGGIVSCDSQQLVQYAQLGVALQRALGSKKPAVGLLNIGEESIKGREEHREAYRELVEMAETGVNFSFKGNIEGHDAFKGIVDVLVADGFTGNVFLKTAEGISQFVFEMFAEVLCKGCGREEFERIARDLKAKIDYSHYPGALLAGVEGVVMKCHGGAPSAALHSAIKGALQMVNCRLLEVMRSELSV